MRIRKIVWYVVALAVSVAAISSGEEPAVLRGVYDDSRAHLQTWRGPKNVYEYLLSGKSGLNVGLTFEGDTPSEAKISLGAGRSLSAQSSGERTVISLFESIGNDITITYDLDANGTWDARLARSGKCEIFRDAQWHTVAEVKDLTTGTPHAKDSDVDYKFSAGAWKPAKK